MAGKKSLNIDSNELLIKMVRKEQLNYGKARI